MPAWTATNESYRERAMATVRRDFLKFAAGAGAGLVCSPLPWRLVGDSALWSQNWSWIPKTPRGEISYQPTACTLCPAVCAVRARCCGSQPVSLWGAGDPLCPRRIVRASSGVPSGAAARDAAWKCPLPPGAAFEAAQKIVSDAGSKGSVAVLDLRPGRTASILYRRHLARLGGRYLTVSPPSAPRSPRSPTRRTAAPFRLSIWIALPSCSASARQCSKPGARRATC